MADVLPPQGPPRTKWYHNAWVVLLIISPLALGPLGLPLLWKSPSFSRPVKIGLTLFTLLWTVWLIVFIFVRVVPAVTNEMQQLNSTYQF